jgi:type I restriction enzyme S subunit
MSKTTSLVPLAQVCDVIDPHPSHRAPERVEDGIPFVGIGDFDSDGKLQIEKARVVPRSFLSEHRGRYSLKENLLAVGRVASIGKVVRLPKSTDPYLVSPTLAILRPRSVDISFLFFALHSPDFQKQLGALSRGSTRRSVGIVDLRAASIPLPSLPEQHRIVGILDQAFEGIATAKDNAEKNLQKSRALFESYLESVFTHGSDGWMEKSLGTLASFRNGINYTKESKGECVKVVGVKDFQKSYWVPSQGLDTVTIDGKLSEPDLLKEGDILAVRSNGNIGLIGRCILAGKISERISHSGFTIRIRLSNGELLPEYLCHFMKCTSSRKRLTDAGTGTNIKSLNQQTLAGLSVPFPSSSDQKTIVTKLESISQETQRLESIYRQKLAALEALKKSLLHQAFSGQL